MNRAALLAFVAVVPRFVPACTLAIESAPDGAPLAAMPLAADRSLRLSYLHSVTRTLVHETLSADAGGLVQRRIEFTEQGPGMPTEPLPGERFALEQGRFVIDAMSRPIGALRMRVDPAQAQTLEIAGRRLSLTQWGARPLSLRVHDCP